MVDQENISPGALKTLPGQREDGVSYCVHTGPTQSRDASHKKPSLEKQEGLRSPLPLPYPMSYLVGPPPYFLRQTGFHLLHWLASELWRSTVTQCWGYRHFLPYSAFMWVPEIQTRVFMLVQQALYH